jgi:hypothetical protein
VATEQASSLIDNLFAGGCKLK